MQRKSSHGGKRPGAGRPKSDRDDVAVKLDRKVVAEARYLAGLEGKTLARFLTDLLGPIVHKQFVTASANNRQ